MATEPQSKPSFTPRRKWGVGFDVAVRTLVVLAVIVMLNRLAGVFFNRQYLSESTKVELSSRTRNLLQLVTNEVAVTIYYDREDDFYPTIAALLREYHASNPKVRVETVDYLRDAAAAGLIKREFGLPETAKAEEKNFVIFKSGSERRVVPGNVLTDTVIEVDQARKKYNRRATAFKGETVFTAMLLAVTNPKPFKACVLQGHREHDLESGDELTGYLDFKSLLQQNAVRVELLSLAGTNEIPADCNLLIIPGPRSVIPGTELEKIAQYLTEGGRLFALVNAAFIDPRAGLERVLAKWGVVVTDKIVTDPANAINSVKMAPGADVMVGAFSKHPAVNSLINFNLNLLAPRAVAPVPARENATDAPRAELLFQTEPSATLVGEPKSPAQAYPLAVAVEKRAVPGVLTGRGTMRMIVVGDSFFLANEPMKLVANRDFAGAAINWLLDRPQFTEGIGPKPFSEYRIVLTAAQMRTVQWLLLGAMPGGILLFGGLVWLRRRK